MVKDIHHISTPIQDSFVTLRSYPNTLKLYKTQSSKMFWMRFYYKNKLYRRSAKTTNLQIAKENLIIFYNQILSEKVEAKVSENSRYSFSHVATEFFHYQQNLIDREERSKNLNLNEKSLMTCHILPFFELPAIRLRE